MLANVLFYERSRRLPITFNVERFMHKHIRVNNSKSSVGRASKLFKII
jgi:hypothetical protein